MSGTVRRIPRETGPRATSRGTGTVRTRPNTAALTRSGRLFALFLVLLVATYGVFLGLALTSTGESGSATTQGLGLLTAAAGIFLVGGFALTLARTPRGLELREGRFVVIEFLGTRRVFPMGGPLDVRVENRYPAGLLAPEATEMVALHLPSGPTRHYLFGVGVLPDVDAPAPRGPTIPESDPRALNP